MALYATVASVERASVVQSGLFYHVRLLVGSQDSGRFATEELKKALENEIGCELIKEDITEFESIEYEDVRSMQSKAPVHAFKIGIFESRYDADRAVSYFNKSRKPVNACHQSAATATVEGTIEAKCTYCKKQFDFLTKGGITLSNLGCCKALFHLECLDVFKSATTTMYLPCPACNKSSLNRKPPSDWSFFKYPNKNLENFESPANSSNPMKSWDDVRDMLFEFGRQYKESRLATHLDRIEEKIDETNAPIIAWHVAKFMNSIQDDYLTSRGSIDITAKKIVEAIILFLYLQDRSPSSQASSMHLIATNSLESNINNVLGRRPEYEAIKLELVKIAKAVNSSHGNKRHVDIQAQDDDESLANAAAKLINPIFKAAEFLKEKCKQMFGALWKWKKAEKIQGHHILERQRSLKMKQRLDNRRPPSIKNFFSLGSRCHITGFDNMAVWESIRNVFFNYGSQYKQQNFVNTNDKKKVELQILHGIAVLMNEIQNEFKSVANVAFRGRLIMEFVLKFMTEGFYKNEIIFSDAATLKEREWNHAYLTTVIRNYNKSTPFFEHIDSLDFLRQKGDSSTHFTSGHFQHLGALVDEDIWKVIDNVFSVVKELYYYVVDKYGKEFRISRLATTSDILSFQKEVKISQNSLNEANNLQKLVDFSKATVLEEMIKYEENKDAFKENVGRNFTYDKYLEKSSSPNHLLLVARDEDQNVVGTLLASTGTNHSLPMISNPNRRMPSEFDWELQRLYIDKNQKGAGLAGRLIRECISRIKENIKNNNRQIGCIWVALHAKNKAGRSVYSSQGFELLPDLEFSTGILQNKIIMKLNLDAKVKEESLQSIYAWVKDERYEGFFNSLANCREGFGNVANDLAEDCKSTYTGFFKHNSLDGPGRVTIGPQEFFDCDFVNTKPCFSSKANSLKPIKLYTYSRLYVKNVGQDFLNADINKIFEANSHETQIVERFGEGHVDLVLYYETIEKRQAFILKIKQVFQPFADTIAIDNNDPLNRLFFPSEPSAESEDKLRVVLAHCDASHDIFKDLKNAGNGHKVRFLDDIKLRKCVGLFYCFKHVIKRHAERENLTSPFESKSAASAAGGSKNNEEVKSTFRDNVRSRLQEICFPGVSSDNELLGRPSIAEIEDPHKQQLVLAYSCHLKREVLKGIKDVNTFNSLIAPSLVSSPTILKADVASSSTTVKADVVAPISAWGSKLIITNITDTNPILKKDPNPKVKPLPIPSVKPVPTNKPPLPAPVLKDLRIKCGGRNCSLPNKEFLFTVAQQENRKIKHGDRYFLPPKCYDCSQKL